MRRWKAALTKITRVEQMENVRLERSVRTAVWLSTALILHNANGRREDTICFWKSHMSVIESIRFHLQNRKRELPVHGDNEN